MKTALLTVILAACVFGILVLVEGPDRGDPIPIPAGTDVRLEYGSLPDLRVSATKEDAVLMEEFMLKRDFLAIKQMADGGRIRMVQRYSRATVIDSAGKYRKLRFLDGREGWIDIVVLAETR